MYMLFERVIFSVQGIDFRLTFNIFLFFSRLAATTARHLEVYSEYFKDTIRRTPGSSLVSIQVNS